MYQQRPPPTTSTTTTTEAPESTTKKGFFSGIRKLFGGGSKSDKEVTTPTPITSSTTARATPTTARPTQAVVTPQRVPQPPPPSSTTSSTTTTRRPATVKEEFPALPGQRQQNAQNIPQSPTTVASVWNRQGPVTQATTPRAVNFVPREPPRPPSPIFTTSTTTQPSVGSVEHEVKELSETLFTKEQANLNRYVTPNYQKHTVSYSLDDDAPQKFLAVDEAQLFAVPTVEKMRALYNNYELDTSVNEHSTALEKNEENDFIDELLKTNVMRTLMQFLQTKNVVTTDPKTHKELLKTIWFTMYSRGQGRIGSSGFEHVFLAENKNNTIVGLHNWIYMYEQEKAGHVDYKGWIKKLDLGNKGAVAKVRFSYNNLNKPVNGVFIGTSPELEIALYTLCFATLPDKDCIVASNGNQFKIRTYTFRYRGKTVIGSAYPEVI